MTDNKNTKEYTKSELEAMFGVIENMPELSTAVWERLYHCTAWFTTVQYMGMHVVVLKSYSTLVAVYIPETEKVYVRNFYSNTTCQHCIKFSNYIRVEYGKYLSAERLLRMGERIRVDKMK